MMSNHAFEICQYHNDHQAAATLMIDDLAPVAITEDGVLRPSNDHGYGMKGPNSLYSYFEDCFLNLFPEAKGSFFILIDRHFNHQPNHNGYTILDEGFSKEYIEFLQSLQPRFDFAFHGTTHGKFENGKILQEFTYLKPDDITRLKKAISKFEDQSQLSFEGGKFPAYQSNEHSARIIEELGFKWWAFSNSMKNKRSKDNKHSYFGEKGHVLSFPTNFSGDSFKTFLKKKGGLDKLKSWCYSARYINLEAYLQQLYENGLVISIQEHFTTLRSDGQYQRPNVLDDLESLKRTYSILRGADIWHAGCNAIARYKENYDFSKLGIKGDQIQLYYRGRYKNPSVSLRSKNCRSIIDSEGNTHEAIRRNQHWVFNNLSPGHYRIS